MRDYSQVNRFSKDQTSHLTLEEVSQARPSRVLALLPAPEATMSGYSPFGDKIKVNMHAGKIVDATVRAVIAEADGLQLQVDFGFEQTALIHAWQVVEE